MWLQRWRWPGPPTSDPGEGVLAFPGTQGVTSLNRRFVGGGCRPLCLRSVALAEGCGEWPHLQLVAPSATGPQPGLVDQAVRRVYPNIGCGGSCPVAQCGRCRRRRHLPGGVGGRARLCEGGACLRRSPILATLRVGSWETCVCVCVVIYRRGIGMLARPGVGSTSDDAAAGDA